MINHKGLILLNKPYGVLCQFRDNEGKITLKDYIKEPHFYAAGRLDADSEGLVVLTNDGKQQHLISDPRHKLPKTYMVQVEGQPDEKALQQLQNGLLLNDGPTKPALACLIREPTWLWPRNPPIRFRKNLPTQWIKITLREGRNRQVRRMCDEVSHPVQRLVRTRIGGIGDASLKPGEFRTLTIKELQRLTGAIAAGARPDGEATTLESENSMVSQTLVEPEAAN